MADFIHHWQVIDGHRNIISNTPEELWDNAIEYFKWCEENPLTTKRKAMSGKEVGKDIVLEYQRPYSVKGMCMHCNIDEEYIKDTLATKNKASQFYVVIAKILYIIHTQNLEFATVDVFNPIFVSKILNMDKEDIPIKNITVSVVTGLPEIAKSENEILEKLELEKQEAEIIKE